MDSVGGPVLSQSQRISLGLIVLLLVDVIWVSSSELTKFIYKHETFEKPFFCTYVKTSMFTFYLVGFLVYPSWKDSFSSNHYSYLESEVEDECMEEHISARLSNPIFVPVKVPDRDSFDKSSGTESDDSSLRSVRFNRVAEVRHLSEVDAADALLARLSYHASVRGRETAKRASTKLTVNEVGKIAFVFCLLWFGANYSYQMALLKTEAGVVNMLSSTSLFYTLVFASIYPSGIQDRFTISKLFAVILSITGIFLVSLSDIKIEGAKVPLGASFASISACLYAAYLVFLKRIVKHEERIDIPMFFGLFNLVLLWPVFLVLHVTKVEPFEWPNKEQFTLLFLNGLMGTVISEALWLWGCFLTSSLMATAAITLTIPMTMIADVVLKHIVYPSMFYLGTIPMVLGFFMVVVCTHFENWDPVLASLHWIYSRFCHKTMSLRLSDSSSLVEQRESLIDSSSNME